MEQTDAEILALKALGWVAGEQETLSQFMAQSGVELDDLRGKAGNLELLAALLDFVLADDALARAFCTEAEIESLRLHQARGLLPGGGQV